MVAPSEFTITQPPNYYITIVLWEQAARATKLKLGQVRVMMDCCF